MEGIESGSGQTQLHKNIRFLRKAMGWSQEELAVRVGLNRGNIASYENGTAEPKISNLLKMSVLFGIPIHDLAHRNLELDPPSSNAGVTGSRREHLDPAILVQYAQRAQELQDVMKGLRTCCKFKLKTIEEASVNDLQIIAMHFEELFNTAQSLMQEHLNLIQHLGNTNPSIPPHAQQNPLTNTEG